MSETPETKKLYLLHELYYSEMKSKFYSTILRHELEIIETLQPLTRSLWMTGTNCRRERRAR